MWREGQHTGFHQVLVDSLLKRFWGRCSYKQPKAVFIPLCGKSVDMVWLANQGLRVIGVEVSPVAIKAFFKEQGLKPSRQREAHFTVWEAGNIKIYCGDYFLLQPSDLGSIDIVYDRAALTALSESKRVKYIEHMHNIMPNISEIFLLTTEDHIEKSAATADIDPEIDRLYADLFDITLVHAERDMPEHSDITMPVQPSAFLKLYDMQLKS